MIGIFIKPIIATKLDILFAFSSSEMTLSLFSKAKIWRNQISTKSIKKELNIEYLVKLTNALKEMGC